MNKILWQKSLCILTHKIIIIIDAKTRQEIEKKAELHKAAKNKIKERIEENVRIAIVKLMELERELLIEVEAEFGENPLC